MLVVVFVAVQTHNTIEIENVNVNGNDYKRREYEEEDHEKRIEKVYVWSSFRCYVCRSECRGFDASTSQIIFKRRSLLFELQTGS